MSLTYSSGTTLFSASVVVLNSIVVEASYGCPAACVKASPWGFATTSVSNVWAPKEALATGAPMAPKAIAATNAAAAVSIFRAPVTRLIAVSI
jgi:hypothetical protein